MNGGALTGRQRPAAVAARTLFEQRIGPLIEPAYHVAFAVLRDRQEAEDAVQEAALSAWRKIGQLREPSSARPWFFKIVLNRARMHQRGRWHSVIKLPDLHVPGPWNEERTLDGFDLRIALRKLGEQDRLLLFLHYGLDLPLDEVASILGLSAAGTKTRLYRISSVCVQRWQPVRTWTCIDGPRAGQAGAARSSLRALSRPARN
ncbi:RNA polymerase sigma factor [Candidatus Nephthysia bennettiae]|uniref:RNA polymerase sigma factor n=1 Tax=Candidatus Nephthysia bennettiae TaxID=3127016 RepID=A0A934K3Z6_9BACT|nr:RNA polymerase sigma factor [Candidatus Dormibacteraeota bacterium]